jgi:hypothetical protein
MYVWAYIQRLMTFKGKVGKRLRDFTQIICGTDSYRNGKYALDRRLIGTANLFSKISQPFTTSE